MKLSELIKEAQKKLELHGDLPVYTFTHEHGFVAPLLGLEVHEKDRHDGLDEKGVVTNY